MNSPRYKKNNKVTIPSKKITQEKKFKVGSEPNAAFNWFPGHMMKAMRDIKSKVSLVDLVFEIRDARLPLASGNRSLTSSMNGKPRLILLNKANLADPEMSEKWAKWFDQQGIPYLFINCLDRSAIKSVISLARKIVEQKRRECSPEGISSKDKYKFMVIGLPNTGKSTFINSLASRQATKTADKPGETQVQLWVKVDEEIDLLDTPGIMPPEIEREEHKIWLSIIHAIPAHIVGEEDSACYLVKYFLKYKSLDFFKRYKLESMDLSLDEALSQIASVRGCLKAKGLPDLDRVYKLILMDFRSGELGRVTFGNPP